MASPSYRDEPAAVVGKSAVLDLTFSADTSILADNDVIAAPQELSNVFRLPGGTAIIQSALLLDEDDQAQDVDIVFLNADGAVGNENAAFAPSDTVARTIVGAISFIATDYVDANTSQFAQKAGVGLVLKGAAASTSLWVAAVCRSGTPTYTAAGLKLKLGILRD